MLAATSVYGQRRATRDSLRRAHRMEETMQNDSIPTDSLARDAMRWAADGKRVVLTYDEYKGKVLWRGDSKRVVTSIEPDTNLIKTNPYK